MQRKGGVRKEDLQRKGRVRGRAGRGRILAEEGRGEEGRLAEEEQG